MTLEQYSARDGHAGAAPEPPSPPGRAGIRGYWRALHQPITYLGLAMLAFVYVTLAYLLITDRKHALEDAERRGGNLVRVLEQAFSHVLRSADAGLVFLRKSYQQNHSNFDLSAWIKDPSIQNELTFNFAIVDANGRIVDTSNVRELIGADRGDREYFRVHVNSAVDEMFLGKPLDLKFSGRRAIVLSRRITAADGAFAGVIIVLLDPTELARHIGAIDLGPDGGIALVGLDGFVRLRAVNGVMDRENIGRKVPLRPDTLGRALRARSGSYWSMPGVFNDVLRLVSYRVLESFPVIAVTTISHAEVYRRANENARIYWGMALPLTAAILLGIGFGARRERRLDEARSAMKTAQAVIEDSRDNLARAEAMALLGHFKLDPGASAFTWSEGAYRIFGKSPSSFTPTLDSVSALCHPDDRPVLERRRRDVMAGIENPHETLRMIKDDGRIIYVEGWSTPIRASDGSVIGMFGTIQDVTAREQAEEALARSEERYRLVEAAANDGIWDWNILTDEYFRSPRGDAILGYADGEIPHRRSAFIDLVHPDDKAAVVAAVRAHLDDNKPYAMEYRLRCKNVGYRWLRSRGQAVRDAEGRPIRMLGAITDITARKQAEAEIAESRDNLARAEAMALLGHYEHEQASGRYIWSEGVYRITGKSPESFTPTLSSVLDLVHPDDQPAAEQYRADLAAGIDPQPLMLRMVRDDGQIVHIQVWTKPILASDGAITGFFGTIQDVTARKLAEEALRLSQERYRLVEDAVNDGIWDWNILTDSEYLSPRWKEILGYADDDIPNSRSAFYDRVHPDDKANVTDALNAHLNDNKPYALEIRLRCKNGEYRWLHSRGMAVRDAAGRPVRMLGTITDIAERKRAEAEIRESRDNLTRAERMALLGHTKFEQPPGQYTWSEGVYRIMGKSPESFTPTLDSSLELIHPDDRLLLERYRRDVMAGLDLPHITLRAIKDDGQLIRVEIWSAPLRASDGTVTGMFGTLQDVTEHKQAEESVARLNQELVEKQYAIDQAVIVAVTDVDGHIVYANDRFCRISGYAREELLGNNHRILNSGFHSKTFFLDMYRQIAKGDIWRGEVCNKAKDGSIYWVDTTVVPQLGPDGNPIAYMAIRIDITARKRAEEALAQANRELEHRVAERTAELAQEMRRREEAQVKLAQTQKMDAVGQLTAGVAHDFNNLLAVIAGGLEFIHGAAARGLTAEPELIDATVRATQRGKELVRRLLAFSRQAPLKAEPTAVDQLVLDTLRLLQRSLSAEVEIVTRLNATLALVSVDRGQLANALVNLALNARQAMPEGGQLIIATTCQPVRAAGAEGAARWPTGEEVCITISDTGVGMTEEVRGRAFEPFFTTKKDGLGTGLGLSMVLGFVEQSGGHIEIDSALENGTTVTIRLPRIDAKAHAAETSEAAELNVRGQEKTVLLVEDDPDVRIMTTAQLKQLGYRVHAVANGNEAIDMIESPANIDITLTDIVLPGGIDGVTLVKEAMRARPRMGVLCMSGYDPAREHRKWLLVQNIEFLEKPFSSARLAQALDATLAR